MLSKMTMDAQTIFTSFILGLFSSGSPCVIPLYPGFLAYLSRGQDGKSGSLGRYLLGIFVLAGVLSMMLFLGGVIALLSVSIASALSVLIPVADGLILIFGIMLLFNFNPFNRLPQIQIPLISNRYMSAFVYGLLYGPIALPCSGPLVVGIFAFSLTTSQILEQLSVFFWFGMGFGLPLLLLSLLSGAAQRWITHAFARQARLINLFGGVLLVSVALYDLWTNWELIAAAWRIGRLQ